MPGRNPFTASLVAVPLALMVLTGCDGRSPASPSRDGLVVSESGLTVSGYVYQAPAPDSGEPPIADALITLRDAAGTESTAVSDRRGFYRVRGTASEVVVRAAKEGYRTRESRFDLTESTVLNFSLTPLLP